MKWERCRFFSALSEEDNTEQHGLMGNIEAMLWINYHHCVFLGFLSSTRRSFEVERLYNSSISIYTHRLFYNTYKVSKHQLYKNKEKKKTSLWNYVSDAEFKNIV